MREFYVDDGFFKVINSEAKAYTLGLILSDGTIPVKSNSVIINLKDDSDNYFLLEKVREYIGGEIRQYLDRRPDGRVFYQIRLYMNSSEMRNDLKKYGIVPNKTKKDTSKIFRFIPEKYMHHFVRGFFDGDGSISIGDYENDLLPKSPSLDFTCNCKQFLKRLQNIICKNTGVRKNKITRSHNCPVLRWQGDSYVINIRKWMYKNATIFLKRKRDKIFKVKNTMKRRPPQSKYIGIRWDRRCAKWRVRVYRGGGKREHIGVFKDDRIAALVREKELILRELKQSKRNFPGKSFEEIDFLLKSEK